MIELNNLTFLYPGANDSGAKAGLKGIDLCIGEGEAIAVIGPNGSGKTTLARCLNALFLPTSGTVYVDRMNTQDKENLYHIRHRVGMVFQNPDNQIVSATVEREIAFGLENTGMPTEQMHETVNFYLRRFDLEKHRRKSPHYLSGGEKQRLALASVLAMQPAYLVLDEPTTLLDPKSRQDILDIIASLSDSTSERKSITTLLITQFPEEACSADRLIVMNEGQIALDDKPNVIYENVSDLQGMGLEPPVRFRMKHLFSRFGLNVKM